MLGKHQVLAYAAATKDEKTKIVGVGEIGAVRLDCKEGRAARDLLRSTPLAHLPARHPWSARVVVLVSSTRST